VQTQRLFGGESHRFLQAQGIRIVFVGLHRGMLISLLTPCLAEVLARTKLPRPEKTADEYPVVARKTTTSSLRKTVAT
jgi:hypothetical protein